MSPSEKTKFSNVWELYLKRYGMQPKDTHSRAEKRLYFPSRSDLFAQKKIKTSIKMFNNFDFGRGFFMASEQNKVSTVAPINHFVPLLT